MSRQFLINSKDRVNGTSTNFEIVLKSYVQNNDNNPPNRIKLIGVQFSNAIYNVNSFNRTISFFETTGTNVSITLPIGFYTATSLATQLATSMTAASTVSNTYTGSYSAITMRITVTANTKTFKFNANYPLIGYYSSQAAALSLVGQDIPKLLIDYLIVQTNFAPSYLGSSSLSGSFIVPLGNCDSSSSIFLGKNELPDIELDFIVNSPLKITLFDQSGNQVDNNNCDIILMFEIC